MEDEYNELSSVSIEESIDRCVNKYGIEGTEDLINRVLSNMEKMRSVYLTAFYERFPFLIKGDKNGR